MRGAWAAMAAAAAVTPLARPARHDPPPRRATGRIEGVATISRELTRSRPPVRVYSEPGTPPPQPASTVDPMAGVVIYLASTPELLHTTPPRIDHPEPVMRQHGEAFVPHVLPILAGTTVQFPNDDPVFHNVFSLSRVKTFDLARYPRGESRPVTFDRPGVVQVFCHIHADMSGYIVVLDNPYFVVPDSTGRFALPDVPPGDYTLEAWQERIRPLQRKIHVSAGATTTISLRIPIPDRAD